MTESDDVSAAWARLAALTPARVALGRSGIGLPTREVLGFAMAHARARDAVHTALDADALTSFEADPQRLFTAVSAACVLTPHEGEFARLFPALRASRDAGAPNKIDRAKAAARRAGCTVLLKGADTVIAAPDGRARVNTHAAPALATAGAGDALAGLIGAGLAQGMDSFEAACAMAWIHGEAGRRMGPGASAETLLHRLPDAMLALQSRLRRMAALTRLRSLSP